MKKEPLKPKGSLSKKDNRGVFSTEQGDEKNKKKKALVSYLEGTKQNPKLPMKSLTPKAPMSKKKK